MKDNKYIVWKRDEMEKWMASHPTEGLPIPVPDAVVIRRQDVFAPPALDSYANAILCVIEAVKGVPSNAPIVERLADTAEYFRGQAEAAYQVRRKLPD